MSSEQYEADQTTATSATGFFKLDRISSLTILATVGLIGITYAPFVLDSSLSVGGYPWLFVLQPVVMVVLGGLFVAATYYGDRLEEDER